MLFHGHLYIINQVQDLSPGLLKSSDLLTHHYESLTCLVGNWTFELNLKTGPTSGRNVTHIEITQEKMAIIKKSKNNKC